MPLSWAAVLSTSALAPSFSGAQNTAATWSPRETNASSTALPKSCWPMMTIRTTVPSVAGGGPRLAYQNQRSLQSGLGPQMTNHAYNGFPLPQAGRDHAPDRTDAVDQEPMAELPPAPKASNRRCGECTACCDGWLK